MKSAPAALLRPVLAASLLAFAGAGCANLGNTANRQPIGLSPTGVEGNGIGTPGGGSADTRATGTVASGEGQPIGVTTPATAPLANPGTTTESPANTTGLRGPR